MSLESFYGGKQGVSPVVKARFKYVSSSYTLINPEGSQKDLNNREYVDPAYGNKVKLNKTPPKSEVMDDCFADVSYEDVWYGQLAIIDTTNKRNPNNGKLFRRVLPRTESEVEEGGTLHGEYIGRIIGPSEGYPKVYLGSLDSMVEKVKNTFTNSGNENYVYPTDDEGNIRDTTDIKNEQELDFDTKDNGTIHKLLADNKKGQIISGYHPEKAENEKYETGIYYSWVNVRSNIDEVDQESYVYLGFQIPYTYFDFDFNAIDWKNDSLFHNWNNETAYKNGSQPFYQKRTFGIPRGVKGNGVGFLTRTTFGRFINSGKEGATEILYDFKDLYEESTGKFDIKDYQGNYPQFEEDNLTEDSAILVYTFYMYDSTYDNDDKTKIVTCYFGKITDIENIELDNDGSFRIKYSSGTSEVLNTLRWIKEIEMFRSKDDPETPEEEGVVDSLRIIYNTLDQDNNNEIEEFKLRFLESLIISDNDEETEKILWAKYTDKDRSEEVLNFSLAHIDGIVIDPETKELKYHTNPKNAEVNFKPYAGAIKQEYKGFLEPTYLNAIEETFIGSDGHLYVKYSSSKYRYDGADGSIGEPYTPNVRYRHIKDDGSAWYKGGDLPDSIGTPEEKWVWWQDLGVVKQTINGVRIATEINVARHNAYMRAIGQSELDWEHFSIQQVLDVLNAKWTDTNGKEQNPYISGHIYIYQMGQETDLDANPIEDRMGQILFYKGNSYFYDFQGQPGGTEDNKRGWKYAGAWSSSDASMQLKIKNGEEIIPDDEQMHRKGFYFNVDSDKSSEMELTEFWS